jgi:hypothetical protein
MEQDNIEGTVMLEDILGGVVAGPEFASVKFMQVRGDWMAHFISSHKFRWPDARSGPFSLLFKDTQGRTVLRAPVPAGDDVVIGPPTTTSPRPANAVRQTA